MPPPKHQLPPGRTPADPPRHNIQRSVRISTTLAAAVDRYCADHGEIDFTAFTKLAFSAYLAGPSMWNEPPASYGRPNHPGGQLPPHQSPGRTGS